MKRDFLILITAEYPFGFMSEVFLESEIPYLSNYFKKILILPRKFTDKKIRHFPKNCEVFDTLYKDNDIKFIKHKYPVIIKTIFMFILELYNINFFKIIFNYRFYLNRIANEINASEKIYLLIKRVKISSPVIYNYWSFGNALSVSILKKNGIVAKAVCRSHGYDLYDERWSIGHLPFRKFVYKHFDSIHPVSKFGLEYLKRKTHKKFHHKINCSYLGIDNNFTLMKKPKNKVPLIVSCSSIISLKRVNLIPSLLKQLNFPVKWIHFGTGPLIDEVKSECHKLPSQIEWSLRGSVESSIIKQFYQNNHIDLFLSTSESEGLPYTMIEAISFCIPIAGCNVGGISEIINKKTGVLLPKEPQIEEWADIIKAFLTKTKKLNLNAICLHQQKNFSANKNYNKFILKFLH